MKKIISATLLLCSLSTLSFSQQDSVLKSKKGYVVLPEKGDFAVGIGAKSIFDFAGNMFSSAGTNSMKLNLLNDNELYFKYFLTSNSAIRAKIGVGISTDHREIEVDDDMDNNNKVTDKHDQNSYNTHVSLGYERRKGKTRLQLAYGAELTMMMSAYKSTNEYGNKMTQENQNPTSSYLYGGSGSSSFRELSSESNNGIGVGLRAFTSIEYFVLPKVSLGGEVGLRYMKYFNGENTQESEHWDYATNAVKVEKDKSINKSSY